MSHKQSTVSHNSEQNSQTDLLKVLKKEIKLLKKELDSLRTQMQTATPDKLPTLLKEERSVEKTVGKILLDFAEDIPIVGTMVKWFR